jgi:ABC-type lipoprotein release transport system permease subunit
MKTKRANKAAARATTQPRSAARPVPLWIRVFTTVSMVGIVAAAGAGARIGFQSGGLGVGFAGMLLGGALGYFATYVLGKMLQEMMPLIRVLLVLAIIAATVYVLHLLGVSLGINPK